MKTGEWPLGQSRREDRCLDKLRLADALAAGAVEQNRIAIRFPNGGQLHTSRPMQAEKHPAWTAAANKDSLRNTKCTYLQFILLANRVVNKTSKVV